MLEIFFNNLYSNQDMLSGMNVLFNLIVVNNWTECAQGEFLFGQFEYYIVAVSVLKVSRNHVCCRL